MRQFLTSNGSSHFHDLWNDDLCFEKSNDNFQTKNNIFMQSQKENSEWHTKRQVNKAKESRNLCQMMMFPSVLDFKNATQQEMTAIFWNMTKVMQLAEHLTRTVMGDF